MVILGIDPGSRCGWALRYDGARIDSGVWDLSSRRFEGGGMRYVRLRSYLRELLDRARPDMVAYEEVRRHLGTDAAHIYGAIVGAVTEECEVRKVPYSGIPVGTVKKTATGKGNANKAAMVEAANRRWGLSLRESDDDEADARWIAEAAAALYDQEPVATGGSR